MFRIIGGVVVYGFAILGATIIVSRYGRGVDLETNQDKSAKRDAEAKGIEVDSAAV